MSNIEEIKRKLQKTTGGSGPPPPGPRQPPARKPPPSPTNRAPALPPSNTRLNPVGRSSQEKRVPNLIPPKLPGSKTKPPLPSMSPPPPVPSSQVRPLFRPSPKPSPTRAAPLLPPEPPRSIPSFSQRNSVSDDADDIYEIEPEPEQSSPNRLPPPVNGGISISQRTSYDGVTLPFTSNYNSELVQIHQTDTRNVTRAGFGTHLQSRVAHEDLLRLGTEEAKVVVELKKLVISRAKAEKEYANALMSISTSASRFDSDLLAQGNSLVYKAWKSIVDETREVGALIQQRAEIMNTSLKDKIDLLIQEKSKAKSQYSTERQRLDEEFRKAKTDMKDYDQKYQRASKSAKDSKQAYNDATVKAKNVKQIDSSKDKFKKGVKKQHETHNEYVLSLRAASTHQEHYSKIILPRVLDCLQQTQESHVVLIKHIFSELAKAVNTASGDFIASHNRVIQNVNDIRIDMEYAMYIENNKVQADPLEAVEFDSTGFNDLPDNLVENGLVMNNLTLETLQHTLSTLNDDQEALRNTITQKEQDQRNLDDEIRHIPSDSNTETAVLDLLTKQKDYRDLSREILNLKCQESKSENQLACVQKQFEATDTENLPAGLDLKESSMDTIPNTHTNTPSTGKRWGLTTILRGERGPNKEVALEDEPWYHGALPRQETEELLKAEGDFIVRFKSDASGQYVLSCKTSEKLRHFPIVHQDDDSYRLEGASFNSIQELINYHMSTLTPVTRQSNAVIKNPICKVRDEHDLRHEEIILGRKLGQGHFGDVHEGTMKKQAVAVKTCKATVDAATRRKFLSEANILKNYNHPNIVKLIGVATDKHPIYIVMELVSGGDLLKLLRDDNKNLSVADRIKMSEDAASGMAYLESKNCIHRDLAARNCLVGAKNSLKISDFGMSREEEEYQIDSNNMRQIPIKWTAPEAMNYGRYTSQSDVWSYGILLWEVFSRGSTPYPGMNNNEAREKIEGGYRMNRPNDCPDPVWDWVIACWRKEPVDRPSFADIKSALKKFHKIYK